MVKLYDVRGSEGVMALFEKEEGTWRQVGDEWRVVVGRNGLGKEKEGDGKTPVGVFALGDVYGYTKLKTAMPFFLAADKKLICVDDSASRYYDRIVDRTRVVEDFESFEPIHRKDDLYEALVTVAYNPHHTPGKGSCIFLHVWRGPHSPTAGCVAMAKEKLLWLIGKLDPKKHPVLTVERWSVGIGVAMNTVVGH
ncbi:L,D-transpeptidase family protein [Hydrogenimonas sp.]